MYLCVYSSCLCRVPVHLCIMLYWARLIGVGGGVGGGDVSAVFLVGVLVSGVGGLCTWCGDVGVVMECRVIDVCSLSLSS